MKLSEAVAGYVGHKQAMGMRFHTEARILRSFCRTSGEVTMQEVTASEVLAFLAGTGPVTRFWERKHSVHAGSSGWRDRARSEQRHARPGIARRSAWHSQVPCGRARNANGDSTFRVPVESRT